MMTVVISPKFCPSPERDDADLVLDGETDFAKIAAEAGKPDRCIKILAGTLNGNGGFNTDGSRYLRPGPGVTIQGAGPGQTIIEAAGSPCRIEIPETSPGVTLGGFSGVGYFGIQNYASRFTCEDVEIAHTFDDRTYLPFGKAGGCTAAFMNWGRDGQVQSDLVYRRCTARMAYHHGFSCNTTGAGAATFQRVTFEECEAISCGSGQEGDGVRDWSCGFDLIDTGHLLGLTVRKCRAIDSWQSGFHTDGSWEGHEQRTADLLFEDCVSEGNGQRSGTTPAELYQCGYYLQDHVTLNRCTAKGNRKAGYLFKNERPRSVVLGSCSDEGSAYGLVIEYGGVGIIARQFVSTGATRRALQATAIDADLEIGIVNFAGDGRPVLLGITERLDFVDAPAHAADLAQYRAISRPFSGSLILEVPASVPISDLVEVHPPSAGSVDLSGVTVQVIEDSGPRPPVPPAPVITAGPVSGGTVSLTMADGEVEIYELVRMPA
jgi:hypothetical protein